jgi:hypothetical protein
MDDQDRLVEKLVQQNAWTEQQLWEVSQELEGRKRELTKVYKRLGQAEERIRLQDWPREVLDMAAAVPPPTTTEGSTQTEEVPMAEGPKMPSPAPASSAPLAPTIEVQGPTPHNSQEGKKAPDLLEVPTAPALPPAIEAGPLRQSQSR